MSQNQTCISSGFSSGFLANWIGTLLCITTLAKCIEWYPRLSGAAINRSPKSYDENPKEERDSFGSSTDETVHQLHVVSHPANEIMGMINWFAVHATSMNVTNKLISGDSKGGRRLNQNGSSYNRVRQQCCQVMKSLTHLQHPFIIWSAAIRDCDFYVIMSTFNP